MSILSKKTVVCERCGKEFETRIALEPCICPECSGVLQKMKKDVKGYLDYRKKMGLSSWKKDEYENVFLHRNQILEKYRNLDGIHLGELKNASKKWWRLKDEEAFDVLVRCDCATITGTLGANYSKKFFVLTDFEKVVVDIEDVFAVGYLGDFWKGNHGEELILCALFTNDPYVPAFPMVYSGRLGITDLFHSKKARKSIEAMFESMCPNLTYPVQEVKALKKQIKSEGMVHGNMDPSLMLDIISMVSSQRSVFYPENMKSDLHPETEVLLEQYCYLEETRIYKTLRMNNFIHRLFWNKKLKAFVDQS